VTVAPALAPEAPLAAEAEPPAEVPLAVPLAEPTEELPVEVPLDVPLPVLLVGPLDEPPVPATPVAAREPPPAAVLPVPAVGRAPEPPAPPVPPVDAAAAAAAAVEVGGGERLPDPGKCPPLDPSLWALFVAGLRAAGLGAALLSADAKSLPSVFWAEKSADAAPPACAAAFVGWATLMRGARGIAGITFIPAEIASDVPSVGPRPTILR
jgi:hypothetical protein